ARQEDFDRVVLPGGAIDDGLPVRGEARGPDRAPPERQAVEGRNRGFALQEAARQEARADAGRDQQGRRGGRNREGAAAGRRGRRKRGRRRGDGGERLQREGDVVGRVKALLGVLLQAVADDPVEPRRNVLARGRELRRVLAQDRGHGVGGGVA